MTTIQDIINFSKPHPNGIDDARQTVLFDDKVIMSIVGGSRGLYGDFVDDFEIAIMDSETKDFVTKYYVSSGDDVLGYKTREEVEDLVNSVFKKGFQVR